MLKKLRNTSLQIKIMILFMSMTIFILAVVGVTYYTNTVRTLNISKEDQMTTIAVETANKIDRFLFERSADIKVLSESNMLIDPEIKENIRLDFLNNVMRAYQTYDSIFVLNLEGDIILSTGELTDINSIKKEFMSEEAYISDIFREENDDDIMFFSRPLLNEDGKRIGSVVEAMNLESINDIVDNVEFGKSGFVKLRVWDSSSEKLANSSLIEFIEDDKIYLRVASPVQVFETHISKWSVEVYQEKEEAYIVVDEFIKYLVLMMFVILILFTFLSIVISRIISEPIRNLMGKMNQFMKDNKKYNMNVQTRDEVKNLALSFDVLFEQLNFMMQMVLEKTGEAAHIDEINENIKGIFESIPNGILTIDAKGSIKSINRYAVKILGLEYDDKTSLSIYNNQSPKLDDFFKDLCISFDKEVKFVDKVCYIKENETKAIPIMFNTLRQTDPFGVLIGMTVIVNDMEEKKKFQERISKAKRLSELGEMSAGVAHEIRNPLASIKGYAQIIRMNLSDDDQNYNDLSIILNEVDRLDRII
ncbi:MAG: histidine kinase dimerization/phospho-acceptor domain-containing protein [Acidaminobacteraceae bacterium]